MPERFPKSDTVQNKNEVLKLQVLPDIDREVLRNGFEKLREYVEARVVNEMPTDIAFIDSAARPLAVGVKEIIVPIYRSKGLQAPRMHFFQIPRGLEEFEQSKKITHERLKEISTRGDQAESARNVLFIDDYYNLGNTFHRLKSLIEEEQQRSLSALPFDWKYFSFFIRQQQDIEEEDEQRIIFGSTSYDIDGNFDTFAYRKLLFKTDEGEVGQHDSDEEDLIPKSSRLSKDAFTGVRKKESSKYVNRSPQRDALLMRALREAVKDVAAEVNAETNKAVRNPFTR